jgi:hypothetical protein
MSLPTIGSAEAKSFRANREKMPIALPLRCAGFPRKFTLSDWTGFTRHFTHLKSQEVSKDRILLLTAILADAINLGLTKMAEACPGATYARLTWLQAWHIRDETYSAALAEVVNAQFRHPFAAFWGDGTTSSSDGQYFRAGGRGEAAGQINAHYGGDPGVLFYTHVSDQYAPFHTQVINATVRDATYVLDGLLYHESDLRIDEHYTDTAGFTDHVFALMHLLGFRFAPRIRLNGSTFVGAQGPQELRRPGWSDRRYGESKAYTGPLGRDSTFSRLD